MVQRMSSLWAHRFVALRINTLGCLLLLTPVSLWSAVVGMSALPVALSWTVTVGARSANAWASARTRGLSGRAAATSAGWWRSATVLVLAVASTVLAAAALRELTVLGDWLSASAIAKPVTGALTIMLLGAIPGTAAVVVVSRSRAMTAASPEQDGLLERDGAVTGRPAGRRAAAVVAPVLGVVNVMVLTSVTPLGEWVREGANKSIIALIVLTLALAAPTAAVWYVSHTGDPEPGR